MEIEAPVPVGDADPGSGVSTYWDHLRRQEMEYLLEYENFEATLTPEQRAALGRAAAPDLEDHKALGTRREVMGLERDIAESSIASEDWVFEDSEEDQIRELCPSLPAEEVQALVGRFEGLVDREAARRKAEVLLMLVGHFLDCKNVRLESAALAFAMGLSDVGGCTTMHEWSQRNGVTRAAVSKQAKSWQRKLDLPEGPHMRPESSCASYSAGQKNHWRRREVEK